MEGGFDETGEHDSRRLHGAVPQFGRVLGEVGFACGVAPEQTEPVGVLSCNGQERSRADALGAGAAVGLEEHLPQSFEDFDEHRSVQLLLGVEVPVDDELRDPRCRSDVLHRRAGVPTAGEDLGGTGHDGRAAVRSGELAGRPPGRGGAGLGGCHGYTRQYTVGPVSNLQLDWSEDELLATHAITEPLVAAGRTCHGGFDADGRYVSPRTRFRHDAIAAWQQHHRETFGTELLDMPLDTWPESYPNVAQAKLLLGEGVPDPIISFLTRIGTVEGFGGLIRFAGVDDMQRHFVEPIAHTATGHLEGGLFEAHARDETGWEDEAGHKEMWFAARDIAFEDPSIGDKTAEMLIRMGLSTDGARVDPEILRRDRIERRVFSDIDVDLEFLLRRMIGLVFIEISAFHIFAWAEEVLSDTDLTAGEGEAARIVSYIRQDETPHIEYLKTTLTEMRDNTFIGESGKRYPGTDIVERLWDRGLEESLGVRDDQNRRALLGEVEHALQGHPRAADVLAEYHALGSYRPDATGTLVPA